jgi:hypothetical protein
MLAAAGAAAACEGLDVGSPVAALTAAAEWAWPVAVGRADGATDIRAAGDGADMATDMDPVVGTAAADVTAAGT